MRNHLHNQWPSFEAIEAAWEPEPTQRPRRLSLEGLATSPGPWAARDYREYEAERQVRELMDTLRRTRRPLDPLTVARVGGLWLIVDGHLRFLAYHRAGWASKVPVRVFRGSAREALCESIEDNAKARLPLTRRERMDAAWKLTRIGGFSKRKIARTTATGDGSVASMRRVLEAMRQAGVDPNKYPRWDDARVALREPGEATDFGEDDMEQEVEEYLEALGKALPPHVADRRGDFLARALVRFAGRKAPELVEHMAGELYERGYRGLPPGGLAGYLEDPEEDF
ncbi:hypothetical protein CKO13_04860 [Halorhodospira neutriphila]|uniref:ParB-like N-terminal domain-containing protein n=1 Tax=Halorhodospira neutriphila TaxID=168379 RepID=A0ABS1E3S2_9GAMM|nr:ParB N-terminal domain-containing protein [Halorhodospira neutriphila]MBK1726363.1 hypothetical protein [Halorhodospira neutriphila]